MKHHRVFFILLSLLALLAGCGVNMGNPTVINGSGKVITEKRDVGSFGGVSLSGVGELTITQGDTEALTIQAEDNIVPVITTEVHGATLEIGIRPQTSIHPTRPIQYNLTVRSLNNIALSGAGAVQSASLKSAHMTLYVSGAGNVKLDHLEADELSASLTGTGNIDVAGQAPSQTVTLSGMGNYRAGSLNSQSGRVTVSGAGKATVRTSASLDVTISGTGSVGYYGNPTVTQHIIGVGRVTSLGSE